MLFNSLSFLLFFPITTALYFLLPHRFRWVHLLICSCIFYAAFIPAYLLILLLVILIDYFAGLFIEKSIGLQRKALLVVSLVANIGLLGVFKYFNFANSNLHALGHFLHWNYSIRNLGMILPIGLSFHTFQSMAYTIEVYRGRQNAERHLGIYSLYVLFYPQLVAGPIERPQHLLHQFRERHEFDADRAFSGLKLMLWGFFKKLVIADRLSAVVDAVYADPSHVGGGYLILATWFFAIQIYCDFSGYSDIAIGAARVLGFRLITNFDRPYASQSVAEFWRRWHISLSTWFRDYLYIPLGGSRVTPPRWCVNIMIVFLISGMWHGAGWTFVVWGALHGIFLIASRLTQPARARIAALVGFTPITKPAMTGAVLSPSPGTPGEGRGEGNSSTATITLSYRNPLASETRRSHPFTNALVVAWRTFLTFNLVSFAWIFFRARTLNDALAVIKGFFRPHFWATPQFTVGVLHAPAFTPFGLNLSLALMGLLLISEWIQFRAGDELFIDRQPVWFRWPAYYCLGLLILWIGALSGQTFIYFQF